MIDEKFHFACFVQWILSVIDDLKKCSSKKKNFNLVYAMTTREIFNYIFIEMLIDPIIFISLRFLTETLRHR